MIQPLFAVVLLLASLFGPTPAHAAAAAVVAASDPSPTSQPASAAAPAKSASDKSVTEVFSETRVGQLFQGKQKVTLEDVRDPMFWFDTVRDLALAVLAFIPRVIVAALFLVFFWLIYRAVRRVMIGSMTKAAVDPSIRDMLAHLIKWSIMGFGIVIACNQIGIQIAALLAGVSIIGLAVGFAAQETLANFIAGIVIFWDKPFKLGDWVEIDSTYGQVQRVTFRSTRILDYTGQVIIYPNTHMLSSRVSNHSTHPLTRVSVAIGIAYKESIPAARAAMLATTEGDKRLAQEPPPQVVVSVCGASSVDLLMRFWIRDESLERPIVHEYTEKCKIALDAAGIQIPFPHMQVFMEETPATQQIASGAMRRAG
jgi:small conductance mechanosensitive channel